MLTEMLRATKGSYQRWAELVDDDTYTWDKLLPYLKKSVDFTKPKDAATYPYDASVYSPEGGPLQVSFPNYRAPCDDFMETAFAKSGLKPIKGLNSGHLDGFAPTTFVINPADQTRSSSEAAFLQEALDTTAMTLYLRTLAKKILFDTNKTANGVLVETNGAEYTISAKKEVILSAGVVCEQTEAPTDFSAKGVSNSSIPLNFFSSQELVKQIASRSLEFL